MSLLNEQPGIVTLHFNLPTEFQVPLTGENETVVSVKVVNAKSPVTVKDWRHPAFFGNTWKFHFPHNYEGVGVKYQVHIQMFHNQQPLLVELDYFVVVNQAPYSKTVNLSPLGMLYVEVKLPETSPAEEAITISLHEATAPKVELVRIKHDERTATSFYLKYDPDSVIPGKRYALTGVENRYHQQVQVSPGAVELSPVSRNLSARLFQSVALWLEKPLRLFTDAGAKIR
ncbi:hypothetical protein ACIOWE_23090 [Pseudomonas sp. NPDC087598]|uniref:hypothetical protein n=1 Tax=Pseudomonas sp. NPDC087598 TaxID=3364440 RepID=UPI0038040016